MDGFRLVARPHVQLHYHVGVLVEHPGQSFRGTIRKLARLPIQELAIGHDGALRECHSTKAQSGILLIGLARKRRRINAHGSVMHHFGISGPKFDGLDKASLLDRNGNDKIAIDIFAVCGEHVGLGHCDHPIRFAELPAFDPYWRCGQVSRIPFGRAFCCPLLNQADLIGGQPAFI